MDPGSHENRYQEHFPGLLQPPASRHLGAFRDRPLVASHERNGMPLEAVWQTVDGSFGRTPSNLATGLARVRTHDDESLWCGFAPEPQKRVRHAIGPLWTSLEVNV